MSLIQDFISELAHATDAELAAIVRGWASLPPRTTNAAIAAALRENVAEARAHDLLGALDQVAARLERAQ